jgi:aspartate racemase
MNQPPPPHAPRGPAFGIVGGLGSLASADVFFKLVKALPVTSGALQSDICLEQHPFSEAQIAGAASAHQTARKLYVFNLVRTFQQRGVGVILLPCFISHTFLDELVAELAPPVLNLMDALRQHVAKTFPAARRLGVLTSDYVRRNGLFERSFDPARYTLIHPRPDIQAECLMAAIYGPHSLKSGHLQGEATVLLARACQNLADQGAELILPGFTEIPLLIEALSACPIPIVDCNQVYAQAALAYGQEPGTKVYKLGIVGGVGPAATVDFINKVVRSTRARRDQEHIKLVVEQNPQIPDRTENLLADGVDPTVALYATCKKLEAASADLIAIPCNTAHAFVERIQPYLGIPIVNMMFETVQYLQRTHPGARTVGLLATDGTVRSRVYHQAMEKAGFQIVVPDQARQRAVMDAIYSPWGVKAGFTEGRCRQDLLGALEHLVRDQGAEIIILGCTELPLILAQSERFPAGGRQVAVVDPTSILAARCVELVQGPVPVS